MTQLLIYIAGPLSNPSANQEAINMERAMDAAWEVSRRGHQPLCPHLTVVLDGYWTATFGETVPYETWIDWALELVRRSDGVLRIEGASPGADRETALAREMGMPVWDRIEDVPAVEGG